MVNEIHLGQTLPATPLSCMVPIYHIKLVSLKLIEFFLCYLTKENELKKKKELKKKNILKMVGLVKRHLNDGFFVCLIIKQHVGVSLGFQKIIFVCFCW